jgi:AsmA protein
LTFPAAQIELDGNRAEGSITVALSEELPRIQATLASERLDLSAYIESFQARINADGPWQTAPVRMSLLDFADLDIRLSAGEILVGAGRLGRSAAAIALSDGELAVNIGEAQFYSGTLAADVAVGMDDDTLRSSVRIALDNTPAGVALTDLAGLSLVDGKTSATIALTGSGKTWGEVAGSLAGTADLAIADGALIGFELAELAALSGGFDVADPGAGTGQVPIDTLAGKLQLADGMITSDDLHAEGESFAIDVGGQVSLIDNRVRAKGVLNATRAGAATDERREIPFVVSGSWVSPLLLPDYERLIRRGDREHGTAPPVGAAARPTPPNG